MPSPSEGLRPSDHLLEYGQEFFTDQEGLGNILGVS